MAADPALCGQTKTCSKCGRRLPLGSFYAQRRGLFGRRPDCKSCHNAYHNGWARRRYVPKTGRRYVSKTDREREAGAAVPEGS